MGKLTKIEAKPDQSKHLETATANVCGLSLDWVQQRGTEVYTADSRIPTVVGPLHFPVSHSLTTYPDYDIATISSPSEPRSKTLSAAT